MTRRYREPAETPPDLTKEQAKRALASMKTKGEQLLASGIVTSADYDTWQNACLGFIGRSFGSHSSYLNTFTGPVTIEVGAYGEGPDERYRAQRRAEQLKEQIAVLGALIEQLDTEIALESAAVPPSTGDDIWTLLHPKVHFVKQRFDAGHFADAAEAALKELNATVKKMVATRTGKELDGADLMHQAFSPKNPVIVLADLSTESGRSEQQGYMELFAGAMSGIRNPKAHANLTITRERAVHFLFVVSLLFFKLDERP